MEVHWKCINRFSKGRIDNPLIVGELIALPFPKYPLSIDECNLEVPRALIKERPACLLPNGCSLRRDNILMQQALPSKSNH